LTANLVAARGQAAARSAAKAATAAVDLCIQVTAVQQSSELGQPAQWSVAAWATGGTVTNAAIALQVSPASVGTAQFSFGCGSGNGTSTCNLGTVDAGSGHLQLQAQLTVPLTAAVTSVSLTVTGSATGLATAPTASAPVTLIGSAAPIPPAGTLPAGITGPGGITVPGATLSSTDGAGTLFPTVNPSAPTSTSTIAGGTRQVDNTTALPTGNNHVGVELVGLFALAWLSSWRSPGYRSGVRLGGARAALTARLRRRRPRLAVRRRGERTGRSKRLPFGGMG
jgi:hypothetical protein